MNGADRILPWLKTALDMAYQRHNVITSNLANIDTPGYQARDLEFGEYLVDELKRSAGSRSQSQGAAPPQVEDRFDGTPGHDGGTVDLETEMATMTSNRLFYETATEVTNRKVALLRYAIDEGGR